MSYYKAVVLFFSDANSGAQLTQSWMLNAPAKRYQFLNQKWWLQAGPRDSVLLVKVKYICTITKAGYDDLVIPMKSFQGRLKDSDPTWLSLVIPNGKAYADDILLRLDGLIIITRQGIQENGVFKSDEIVSTILEDIRQDRGSQHSSLTLSGHKTIAYTEGQKRIALEGVNYRAEYSGKRRFRCRFDQELRPSDIAQIKATSEELTVGEISYQVNTNTTVMEVTEG